MTKHHFLLLSCPSQGHINPTLELAKKLTSAGAHVTLATTVRGLRQLTNLPALDGLSYASFSDGNDDGSQPTDDLGRVMAEFRRVGSQTLTKLLLTLSNEGRQVSFIIYSILLPWAAEVAREMHLPSAFLCSQSATTFAIFQKFFNSREGLYLGNIDLSISIQLPGLPLLASNDLPTFLLPTSPYYSTNSSIQEHIQTLEQDPNPCILVNTFDALEEDSIKSVDNMNVITIGPLIPSDNSVRIDLFEQSEENYLRWLDSKPDRSVVYVSFGSMVVLHKRQIEEILQGLVESQRPFLWVIKSTEYEGEVKDMIEAVLKKEEDVGLILPWCSQMEVLSHRSTGCFLTHCGWNSITESLVVGVPVVGCPHWSDQTTNAKLVEEVWGTGVRAVVNEEGVVEREEIRRCLDVVMGGGERGEEMRRNSVKWKGLAAEAVKEGGSSHTNFKQFLERLW